MNDVAIVPCGGPGRKQPTAGAHVAFLVHRVVVEKLDPRPIRLSIDGAALSGSEDVHRADDRAVVLDASTHAPVSVRLSPLVAIDAERTERRVVAIPRREMEIGHVCSALRPVSRDVDQNVTEQVLGGPADVEIAAHLFHQHVAPRLLTKTEIAHDVFGAELVGAQVAIVFAPKNRVGFPFYLNGGIGGELRREFSS